MIKLYLEKLYRYPRIQEHMSVAVPFKEGQLFDLSRVKVWDVDRSLPMQCKATAKYPDGSVKYLFLRFVGDLPGNEKKEFVLDWAEEYDVDLACKEARCKKSTVREETCPKEIVPLTVEEIPGGFDVVNGEFLFTVKNESTSLFGGLFDGHQVYGDGRFVGPVLEPANGEMVLPAGDTLYHTWEIVEQGPLCVILLGKGEHVCKSEDGQGTVDERKQSRYQFETKLTVYAGKPWVEVSYRIINTTLKPLEIGALGFYIKADKDSQVNSNLGAAGHSGMMKNVSGNRDSGMLVEGEQIYRIKGTSGLGEIEDLCPVSEVRTCTGYSNYKTDFTIGCGQTVVETATSERLMVESNEHFPEVFYGTFFADRCDERGGICATIFQAQQNYPKAVMASKDGIAVMLVPRGEDKVIMQSGMSREQKFLLHFHGAEESLAELDNRSLIYQMPDRPVIDPCVFKEAGVMADVFPDHMDKNTELMLIRKCDGHNKVFGMMNWGDSFDANYTNQGRGGGEPVWSNNEYDFPHACALMYARTGTRRFLDYLLVNASHWQDVDIVHYSEDPLRLGGQVEHIRGHVIGGKIVPSHEWVEGLLDYYHFTGDERGLRSAIGIGENVLRLLDTPMYAKTGEMNARETGWALRTLTALYVETGEEKWLSKAQWIVGHFKDWEEEYGHWLAPYTDNTLIRVGFMISVAVGSLMRYYRVRPSQELKDMMLRAIDDLVENCRLDNGLFYYKELPSLCRLGNNTLLLEAMAIGYELSGDVKYLQAGMETFTQAHWDNRAGFGGKRTKTSDAIIWPGESGKSFAQSFLPLATFDRAIEKAGLRGLR